MGENNGDYEQLIAEMEAWEKSFSHKKPCKEFKETGWCLHLANAQHRKFRQRIDGQF